MIELSCPFSPCPGKVPSEVTIDAAGLCVLASNAVILRGGSDSQHSSALLADIMVRGLVAADLPPAAVQIVPTADRAAVGAMADLDYAWIRGVVS